MSTCDGFQSYRSQPSGSHPVAGLPHYLPCNGSRQPHTYDQLADDSLRRKIPGRVLEAAYHSSLDNIKPHKVRIISGQERHHPGNINSPGALQYSQGHGAYCAFPTGEPIWRTPYNSWALFNLSSQQTIPVNSMDSMLQQMPAYNAPSPMHHGTGIASVLQPSPHHIGPTASYLQRSGPYGPYWYDGTYVPYRPAAVRDPRFYHHSHPSWSGTPHGGPRPYPFAQLEGGQKWQEVQNHSHRAPSNYSPHSGRP